MEKRFDWSHVEPAHPMLIKLHEDLRSILVLIRDKFQADVSQAFDRASRGIGFVVTTSLPVAVELGGKGEIKSVNLESENLKETIFNRELSEVMGKMKGAAVPHAAAGSYKILLIWPDALKLKLRADWVEPAHFRFEAGLAGRVPQFRDHIEPAHFTNVLRERVDLIPGVREPAHWFDPGIAIAVEEKVLITVLDEVYPELRLAERVAAYRDILRRKVRPEVMEPAHFHPVDRVDSQSKLQDVLVDLSSVLRRHGF